MLPVLLKRVDFLFRLNGILYFVMFIKFEHALNYMHFREEVVVKEPIHNLRSITYFHTASCDQDCLSFPRVKREDSVECYTWDSTLNNVLLFLLSFNYGKKCAFATVKWQFYSSDLMF